MHVLPPPARRPAPACGTRTGRHSRTARSAPSGSTTKTGGHRASIRQLLSETYAGFRRAAVFPVEGDGMEAGGAIEREGRGLPDARLEDESPHAECARLGLERR